MTPIDTAALECLSRTDDFESVVYDPSGDVLYVTSGNCCNAGLPTVYYWDNSGPPPVLKSKAYPFNPTVWKLTRVGGHFTPTSWQALPEGEDPTAAGWRPGTGMYYGKNGYLRTYDFATNAHRLEDHLGVAQQHRRRRLHRREHCVHHHRHEGHVDGPHHRDLRLDGPASTPFDGSRRSRA